MAETPAKPGSDIVWAKLSEPFHAVRVRADRSFYCAISQRGTVACWGTPTATSAAPAAVQAERGIAKRIVGVSDVVDVGIWSGWVCVAQRSGPGGCFAADPWVRIAQRPTPMPTWPSPPVEFAQRGYQGLCARLVDGRVSCIDATAAATTAAATTAAATTAAADLPAIAGVVSIACDPARCCAATADGVWCFTDEKPPELQPGSRGAQKLAVGFKQTCTRTASGGSRCWGPQRLGDDLVHEHVRDVITLDREACVIDDAGAIACSGHANRPPAATDIVDAAEQCTVRTDGSVRCTGTNMQGELGDGRPLLAASPIQVPGVTGAIDVRVDQARACALLADRSVRCWDRGGAASGELDAFSTVPSCGIRERRAVCAERSVDAPANVISFARTPSFQCVVTDRGELHCATAYVGSRWEKVKLSAPAVAVFDVYPAVCATLKTGHIECAHLSAERWQRRELSPAWAALADVVELAPGMAPCARTQAGAVWCGSFDGIPVERPALRGATALAGGSRTCAIVDGALWCWGSDRDGLAGNGAIGTPNELGLRYDTEPVRVTASFKATRVSVGMGAACAIDDKQQVWCWGSDANGQLGQGRTLESKTPVGVVGIGPS